MSSDSASEESKGCTMPPSPPPLLSREEILSLKNGGQTQARRSQPIYRTQFEIKTSSVKGLLGYLDFLKPLLLMNNDLITHAVKMFEGLQARVRPPDLPLRLESFELSMSNVRKFFPSEEPSIEHILQLLSFKKPTLGQYVYLLDVLTVLVVIFRAPTDGLREKARWLFDWYNFSKTGTMTEIEHVLLIKRVSDCMVRIKAIGRIDVSEDDANHIALEARVRKTADGQIRFIPGLTFEDFYMWTRDSAECAVLVKFVVVQDRLVDALQALRSRVDSVLTIVDDMRRNREFAVHVPKMDMFPAMQHCAAPLFMSLRTDRSVTVLVAAMAACDPWAQSPSVSEVFVRCCRSRPVPEPLYNIPDSTMQRKRAKGQRAIPSGLPQCCQREYELTSYLRVPLRRVKITDEGGVPPLLRVDITQLEPESHYEFTVYTPSWSFPPIAATTLPVAERDHASVTVAVLPATLSLADTDSFVGSTPLLDTAGAIVHSGTLCSIDSIIRQSLLFADADMRGGADVYALARAMVASSQAVYSITWADAVGRLTGLCSAAAAPAAARLSGLYPHHGRKQALYHNGMGPWGSPQVRAQLADLLGPLQFASVEQRLEREYARFAASTCPPRPALSVGSVTLVFARCPNFADSSPEGSDLANISASELTEELVLQSLGAVGEEEQGEGEDPRPGALGKLRDQLVIVLRSPLDLVDTLLLWAEQPVDSRPSSPALAVATPTPVAVLPARVPVPIDQAVDVDGDELQEPPPGPRLTGRHELIHGEFSSKRALTAAEAALLVAPDFNAGAPPLRSTKQVLNADSEAAAQPSRRPLAQHKLSLVTRDPSNSDFDYGLEAFIKAVFVWMSCGGERAGRASRQTRLVSTGWSQGINFEIVHRPSGRRLEHVCLLPALSEADLERGGGAAALALNLRLVSRLRVSLPEDCIFTALSASPLRAVALQAPSAQSGTEPTLSFVPINEILDKELPVLGLAPPSEPVKLLDGPRILRLTSTEAHVLVAAVGHGKVRATLFELPFEVNAKIALGLVASERDKLRVVGSMWQRCAKQRHMRFSFTNLLPYCNYCVLVEPIVPASPSGSVPGDGDLPRVAQFRTLYNTGSCMSSVVLAAVSEADYALPSAGLSKVTHLLDGARPPSAPVHLVHHFTRRSLLGIGVTKPHRADLQHLYQRAEVVHTLAAPRPGERVRTAAIRDDRPDLDLLAAHSEYEDGDLSRINLSSSGKFSRLAPRDGSEESLVAMVGIVAKLDTHSPATENLLVIVQRPVIRFLQKHDDGKWSNDGIHRTQMALRCLLLEMLLLWKARAPGRDVQIVTFAEVSVMQVATVGFRQPREAYDHAASLGLLDRESITEVALEIMSSSVAYEDKDDDASSIASGEQEQKGEAEGPEAGIMQFGLGWEEEEAKREASQELPPGSRGSLGSRGSRAREGSIDSLEGAGPGMLALGAQSIEGGSRTGSRADSRQSQDGQGSIVVIAELSGGGTSGTSGPAELEGSVAASLSSSLDQGDAALLLPADGSGDRPASKGSSWGFSLTRSPSRQSDKPGSPSVGERPSSSSMFGGGGLLSSLGNKLAKAGAALTSGLDKMMKAGDADENHEPEAEKEPEVELEQPSFLESIADTQSTASHVTFYGPNVNLRHIILPIWDGGRQTADDRARVLFPDGLNMMGDRLEYFLNRDTADFGNVNVVQMKQPRELYGSVVNSALEPEASVFLLDLFIRPGEGNTINNDSTPFVDHPEESVVGSVQPNDVGSSVGGPVGSHPDTHPHDLALQQLRLPPEVRARNRKSYQYHYVMSRSFVHHVDFFELLMGPVIGALTTTSARVLFEVNLDLVTLDVVARPLRRQGQAPPPDVKVVGDDEPPIDDCVLTMTNIQAYKVFSCDFEGLSPNRIYQVMIPELWGDKVFGSFRTQKQFTRHAELLIAGYGSFNNNPMMAAMLDQFYSQQMIEYKFLFREQRIVYAARIAGLLSGFPFPSLQESNMWTLLAERLQTPLVETNFVIHLDSQAFLTAFLGQLINVLLEAGRRLFLPLRDASAVEAYYFNQFEEVVRDTFRLVWSVPVLREALAAGAHQPLFHPEYLVSSRAIPPNTLQTAADEKLVAVIRKVFETHFMSYVVRLYNWQPDSGHHARVWKQGPMVVIMLDLVTGRKKLKNKKKDNASEAGGGAGSEQSESAPTEKSSPTTKGKKGAASAEAAAPAIAYSLGFLDKEQWKLIKNVAEDDLVTQVVIVSQQPFLTLHDLPTEPLQPPSEIPKGECLEWRPTLMDMQQFLLFWIEWLQHKPRRPVLSKNVALVSGSSIPYVTTVQDLKTGSKIHQMCVGPFNVDPIGERGAGSHPPSVPSLGEFVLKGKIGRLRYQHRFTELDRVLIDCSREPSRGAHFDPGMDLSPLLRPCYGQLKFYFDSWRASGLWRIVTDSDHRKKDSSDIGALLLVGPILGAPVVTEATADDNLGPDATEADFLFRVGVLIEVDCFTTVTFAVEHAFTGEVQHFAFECVANRPITCSIGPLEIANRYNCQIVSGVRQSQCVPFVVSTHINWSESNFAFLNCKMADGTLPAEDFAKEVLNRCKVPFSGITAVVHLNSFPDMTPEIEELRRLPFLRASLEHCQKLGHLTAEVFYYLDSLMEQVRDLFRRHLARPMYAEVLRTGFTLFMQTYPLFRHYAHIDEDGDDEDETTAVESESEAVLRFLHLAFTRVYQEYFDQVNRPRDNVLRARFKRQPDEEEPMMAVGEITEEQLAYAAAEDKRKQIMIDELSIDAFSVEATLRVEKTNPEAHPVKVVFKQWLREMRPFPPLWHNWLAPNRRAVIELMPAMEPKNYVAVFEKFEAGNEPLDQGVRVIVIDGKRDGSGLDSCLMDEDPDDPDPEMGNGGQKLFRQAYKYKMGGDWAAGVVARGKKVRPEREVMFVCPTEKFGTRRIPLQVPKEIEDQEDFKAMALERPFSGVWAVDSFYRCNAAERAMKMLEVEERIKKENKAREKAEGGKAKTKKIQAQRAEEERVRIAESQKQLDEVLKSLVPDGYLFIECRTSLMMASGGKADVLSSAQGRIVSSLRMDVSTPNGAVASSDPSPENFALADQDGTPSIVDYLQIPDWLDKFFPSHEGVFVQDDILLYMRQDPDTREILKQLEGDEVVVKGVELYERSRLSELSRPPDLREVDMDGPGVVSLFLKDLVDRYWEEAVADDIKPFLVPIRDDFLRAFILSRALPEPASQLAAADKFARGMQHALVLAVSLKLSMDLSLHNPKKYQEIMDRPGEAEAAAVAMADEDRRRKDFHDRARFESAARVKAYKETLAKYQAKAKAEKIPPSAVLMEEDRLSKLIEAATYKEEETEAVYRGQLAEREAKRDDDSDLEELEEEERWVAEQERINDELEEAADRLEELREKEEEEAEAAREAAGLNEEEEQEEEEDEGEVTDEAAAFDSELAEAAAKEKADAEKEEEKARLAALRAPVKKKTKAQLMAEKAAADEVLLMDALAISYEQGMELALDDHIEVICLEHVFQADLDELMRRRPRQTDQEALEESTLQMARLAAEKVAVRRGLGRRVVFLSS